MTFRRPWRGLMPLFLLMPATSSFAGEFRILASNALSTTLTQVKPQIEKLTGDSLTVQYDTASALRNNINAGAPFDIAILTTAADQDLLNSGRVIAGSIHAVARSGIGVVVRTGSAKPDISTASAFRRALMSAKSIVYTTNGASGMYIELLLNQLGLTDIVAAKSIRPSGGAVAELVARGEAELGIQQISELLPVAGVEYLGPLPPPLQHFTEFGAAISTQSQNVRSAEAVIALLQSATTRETLRGNGLEPAQDSTAGN